MVCPDILLRQCVNGATTAVLQMTELETSIFEKKFLRVILFYSRTRPNSPGFSLHTGSASGLSCYHHSGGLHEVTTSDKSLVLMMITATLKANNNASRALTASEETAEALKQSPAHSKHHQALTQVCPNTKPTANGQV